MSELGEALRRGGHDARVFFVCGYDHYDKCGLHRGMDRAGLHRAGLVVLPRDGLRALPDPAKHIYAADAEPPTVSSAQIRELLMCRAPDGLLPPAQMQKQNVRRNVLNVS